MTSGLDRVRVPGPMPRPGNPLGSADMNFCQRISTRGIAGLATAIALAAWTPTLLASTQRAEDDPSTLSHNRGVDTWPTVQITCPRPSQLLALPAPPSVRVEWEGTPGAKQGHHKI